MEAEAMHVLFVHANFPAQFRRAAGGDGTDCLGDSADQDDTIFNIE
jgi:hypothetical protein